MSSELTQSIDVEPDEVSEPELDGEAHRLSEVPGVAVLDQFDQFLPHRGRDLDRAGSVRGSVTDERAYRVGAARKPARLPERLELLLFLRVEAHAEESGRAGVGTGRWHACNNIKRIFRYM